METEYTLVFGGGGTKGVYEMGVWTALREMGVKIKAVIGTSIGAINALMYAQKDFKAAKALWKEIRFEDVFDVAVKDRVQQTHTNLLKIFSTMGKLYFAGKPLDPAPLRKLITNKFNWDKLRGSGLDFGLVTFNVSDLQPMEVYLEDLNKENVVDFLLASAAFPGFKETKIGKKSFVDGGVWDNVPIRAAIRRGYRQIIAVDVSGIGNNRPVAYQGLNLVYIKNSMDFGHILDFEPSFLRDYQLLGYLDTLRIFNQLQGRKYFLEDSHHILPQWNRQIAQPQFHQELKNLFPWMKAFSPQHLLPRKLVEHHNPALILWESLAQSLNLPRLQKYQGQEIVKAIELRLQRMEQKILNAKVETYKNIFQALGAEIKHPLISRALNENSPVELWFILKKSGFHKAHPGVFSMLYSLVPKLHTGLVLLKALTSSLSGYPKVRLKGRLLLDLLRD
jgi:predicted acylesterase/phospholipase RssA